MNDWFIIKNLEEFIDASRLLVFVNFATEDSQKPIEYMPINDLSPKDKEELDKVLSHTESLAIAKTHLTKQKNSKSKKIRYVLSEDDYANIIADLNQRMVSNLMRQLVNKGLVETGFDEEANDFVFWVKDNVKNKEKPETD